MMITRRRLLSLLACFTADRAFGQGMASRGVKPQPRGKPSGRPFLAHLTDVAEQAGLTHPLVSDNNRRQRSRLSGIVVSS